MAQLRLTGDIDLWECTVDDIKIFTIKGMRSHIINTTSPLPTTSSLTRWNNLIPLKVNVLTWKTANQRLPTRSNLDFRGIDLHSVLCPLCEEWNIHRIRVTCLTDAINLADMVPLTAAAKMFFDTAVQATLWTLWKFCNETIFASKRPNKRLILDDIKLSSFTCDDDVENESDKYDVEESKARRDYGKVERPTTLEEKATTTKSPERKK
ncbi:RNA-directed DNA polymerase, eukaryota, reverse transcriptase zinc-binding domain protein [Tanacetum coccineum]